MSKILRKLEAQIADDQLAVLIELARRLAPFGYTRDEVVEHACYHGGKVLERVAAGHEAEAERVKRVAVKVGATG